MKIVVTDGYALNPGDLSWNEIKRLGELTVYERTPKDIIAERCKDADIVITNKVPFNKTTIEQLRKLKLISVSATGYNVIDVNTAKEKGIIVCNVPAYGTASVAQHTFALILELTNHVGLHATSVEKGEWQNAVDWCYTKAPVTELKGKTLGLAGFGNIGQQVARIAAAFDMYVLYTATSEKENAMATYADTETLFAKSDIVSLHCPLTTENNQFVNKHLLHHMKSSALLINTARGQLINEQDLADALNNNIIAGAGLDVLSTEPPEANNPLLYAKNCIITPHNAWISKEARQRIMTVTAKNIEAFLLGKPVNAVN